MTEELIKRVDSLLCHLEWVLCLLPEDERRSERDSLFFKNSIFDAADLSFLPLVYPDKLHYFFTQALSHPGKIMSSFYKSDQMMYSDVNADRMLHRKWTETMQQPSIEKSGYQIS